MNTPTMELSKEIDSLAPTGTRRWHQTIFVGKASRACDFNDQCCSGNFFDENCLAPASTRATKGFQDHNCHDQCCFGSFFDENCLAPTSTRATKGFQEHDCHNKCWSGSFFDEIASTRTIIISKGGLLVPSMRKHCFLIMFRTDFDSGVLERSTSRVPNIAEAIPGIPGTKFD